MKRNLFIIMSWHCELLTCVGRQARFISNPGGNNYD